MKLDELAGTLTTIVMVFIYGLFMFAAVLGGVALVTRFFKIVLL